MKLELAGLIFQLADEPVLRRPGTLQHHGSGAQPPEGPHLAARSREAPIRVPDRHENDMGVR